MRIILIDKLKTMCYYMGVNKRAPNQGERQVPMAATKQFRKRNAILECHCAIGAVNSAVIQRRRINHAPTQAMLTKLAAWPDTVP